MAVENPSVNGCQLWVVSPKEENMASFANPNSALDEAVHSRSSVLFGTIILVLVWMTGRCCGCAEAAW